MNRAFSKYTAGFWLRIVLILGAGAAILHAEESPPPRMEAREGQSASVSVTRPVESGRDYMLKIRVRSEGIFTVTAGALSLSYNRPGEWQTLAGVIRTGTAPSVKVTFSLRGGTGPETDAQLEGFQMDLLGPIPPPTAGPWSGKTLLSGTGAAIVYPDGNAGYRQLAESVRRAVKESGGPDLPVLTDKEVMEEREPRLRAAYLKKPLLLLGRLTNNRAFWPAYIRFLDATDGYYPGGDGYVVRTAVGAGDANTNHVILGGSSDRGIERAVERFCQNLKTRTEPALPDKEWELPYLLDVALGGECLTAFDENDKLWSEDPLNHLLPKVESGYGTVLRFYENAMAWYWSGRASYRQRARAIFATILKEKAYTHQYPLEFFVRTIRMLEGTGFFEPGEFVQSVTLLATNFRDFSSQEISWMPRFSPPYGAIGISNRHQIAPWMSDLANAGFLRRFYPSGTDLGDVIEFRYSEKRAFLDAVVRDRWGTSVPGVGSGGHEEEILGSLFRYALDHEQFAFFTGGNARRAAEEFVAKINPKTGAMVRPSDAPDHELLTGVMACYDGDPSFAFLRRHLQRTTASSAPFARRYVNGVHRYYPGPEVRDADAQDASGVWAAGLMPHNFPLLQQIKEAPFMGTPLALKDILDFAVIRSGSQADSDHISLSGILHDALPNVLTSFSSAGVDWLLFPSSRHYYDQNAVDVQRLDQWPKAARYGSAARKNWVADLGVSGGFSATLEPFAGTTWTREILWIGAGIWIFKDSVRAMEAGQFSATVTWASAFPLQREGQRWKTETGGASLWFTPLSSDWNAVLDQELDRSWKKESYFLREKRVASLDAGECVSAVNLLQVVKNGAAPLRAEWKSPFRLALSAESDPKDVTYIGWPGGTLPGMEIKAEAFVLERDSFRVFRCRELTVDGQRVFSSREPQDLFCNRESRQIVAGRAATPVPAEAESLWPALDALASDFQRQPEKTAEVSAIGGVMAANVRDTPWPEAWRFSGFRRPVPVLTGHTVDGVLDLERTYPMAEISLRDRSNAQEGALPDSIQVAAPILVDGKEEMPGPDSAAWKEVGGKKVWRPSITTGNYGQADPVEKGYQSVFLQGLPVRYVRAKNASRLTYYTGEGKKAVPPLAVEPIPGRNGGPGRIFVHSDIWPEYRWMREENAVLGVLSASGQPTFMYDVPCNLQATALVDIDGRGDLSIGVLTADARLRIFDTDGQLLRDWEFYKQHRQFDQAFGKPNQRAPAGLFTQPASFGIWRRGAAGKPQWVIGRYCMLSFLDEEGGLQGVLRAGSYWNPGVLEEGVDFNGDGKMETLAIGAGEILHVDGDPTPHVTEPGGDLYYPQVYRQQTTILPEVDSRTGLAGAPILGLKTLALGNKPRYVLIVRKDCLVIYDARDRRIAFSWVPVVPLDASAIVRDDATGLAVLCATKDRQLWRLEWNKDPSKLERFSTVALPDRISHIAGNPGRWVNRAVLSGSEGLYLTNEHLALERVAKGSFHSAFLCEQAGDAPVFSLIAATGDGDVVRFDASKP
jgi:hypothetical protein